MHTHYFLGYLSYHVLFTMPNHGDAILYRFIFIKSVNNFMKLDAKSAITRSSPAHVLDRSLSGIFGLLLLASALSQYYTTSAFVSMQNCTTPMLVLGSSWLLSNDNDYSLDYNARRLFSLLMCCQCVMFFGAIMNTTLYNFDEHSYSNLLNSGVVLFDCACYILAPKIRSVWKCWRFGRCR